MIPMGTEPGAPKPKMRIEALHVPGGGLVKLDGDLDEHFNRQALAEAVRGVTVFEMQGVKRVTSFGAREWIKGLKALPSSTSASFGVGPR